MAKERKPLLADLVAANSHPRSEKNWLAARMNSLRTAKRFVLDTQASGYLGEMIMNHPRIIVDAQDFAIPPFKNMWIEFDADALFRAINVVRKDESERRMTGFLFEGSCVYSFAGDGISQVGEILPFEYVLNRPMKERERAALIEMIDTKEVRKLDTEQAIDLWLWGAPCIKALAPHLVTGATAADLDQIEQTWNFKSLRTLIEGHTARIAGWGKPNDELDKELLSNFTTGGLSTIIALLLFLNRTQDIQTIEPVDHARGAIKKKIRPWVGHSVISLKLNPKPRFRVLTANHTGVHRRFHDVRGHYCHDLKARTTNCVHGIDIIEGADWWLEYEPLKWKCTECGGKRWWRNEHSRGSFEEGVSLQTYAVTK